MKRATKLIIATVQLRGAVEERREEVVKGSDRRDAQIIFNITASRRTVLK